MGSEISYQAAEREMLLVARGWRIAFRFSLKFVIFFFFKFVIFNMAQHDLGSTYKMSSPRFLPRRLLVSGLEKALGLCPFSRHSGAGLRALRQGPGQGGCGLAAGSGVENSGRLGSHSSREEVGGIPMHVVSGRGC